MGLSVGKLSYLIIFEDVSLPLCSSPLLTKVEKKRREEEAFDSRVSRVEEAIKENKKRKIVK
jgi:hypothetical protein